MWGYGNRYGDGKSGRDVPCRCKMGFRKEEELLAAGAKEIIEKPQELIRFFIHEV